jgi:Kef-type K+ transport system membrane component KefB
VQNIVGVIEIIGPFIGAQGMLNVLLRQAQKRIQPIFSHFSKFAGEALLIPVFFVTIGLSADLHTVGPVLPFALGLLVVAVLGKVVGSGLVGIGMVARGEVALVAATLGLKSGAIDGGVFSAIVLVALATTVITPVALTLWTRRASIPLLSDVAADGGLALSPSAVDGD